MIVDNENRKIIISLTKNPLLKFQKENHYLRYARALKFHWNSSNTVSPRGIFNIMFVYRFVSFVFGKANVFNFFLIFKKPWRKKNIIIIKHLKRNVVCYIKVVVALGEICSLWRGIGECPHRWTDGRVDAKWDTNGGPPVLGSWCESNAFRK